MKIYIIHENEENHVIEVYIDGASAGNPGLSGAGVFIKGHGKSEKYVIPLGIMSNHEAEFHSLIKGLEICIKNNYQTVSFRTDSELVERAIAKKFIKNKQFLPLFQEALHLSSKLQLFFLKWVPSKQNSVADELARKAITLNEMEN